MKNIIFVMAYSPNRDMRIKKETTTLRQCGYKTALICWDREGEVIIPENVKDNYDKIVCFKTKAPYGSKKLMAFLPLWWCFVIKALLTNKWDIVHAVNFHSIIPCLIGGFLKRKPTVYEIIDVYQDSMNFNKIFRNIWWSIDKLCMRCAKGIIVLDSEQIKGMGGIPNNNIAIIYDSPPDNISNRSLNINDKNKGEFTLFYAGVLYTDRHLNIDKVIEAIKEINGARLIIAGYGDMVPDIRKLSQEMPEKIEFLGKISYEEVIKRGSKADLFFVLRDSSVLINKYICGSTIFNAMLCGRPVLSNTGTSTSQKVAEENCGISVNPENIREIQQAIISLQNDPELHKKLGENARKAYEGKYRWRIMEQRLQLFYGGIAGESGRLKEKTTAG